MSQYRFFIYLSSSVFLPSEGLHPRNRWQLALLYPNGAVGASTVAQILFMGFLGCAVLQSEP